MAMSSPRRYGMFLGKGYAAGLGREEGLAAWFCKVEPGPEVGGMTSQGPFYTWGFKPIQLERQEATFHISLPKL